MWGRLLVRATLVAAALGAPAAAVAQQVPPLIVEPEGRPDFLPRFDFWVSLEALSEHDTHFYWDADLGTSFDVVDYGRGRAEVVFNYEMVLGNELQPFDPRLGTYTIDILGTWRFGGVEIGPLFRHVSRHVSDREKTFGIAWDDLGLGVRHVRRSGAWVWQVRAEALANVLHNYVDYGPALGGDVTFRRGGSGRSSLVGSGGAVVRFVRQSPIERDTQYGLRGELGLRVEGRAAALEFFGGAERRIDADPFEFHPRQWLFVGMRLVTR